MSQLSFADVFNMARESAGSKINTQDTQPGSESYPSVQRLMSAQYSRSRFISVFRSTGPSWGAGKCSVIFCHSPPVSWIWPG